MPSLNFNIKNGLSIGVGATILNTVNTNIGIGKTNPTNKLDIVGGVSATGSGLFGGPVTGTTGTFSGLVTGTGGSFSGPVSGTTGTFTGAVSGTTGTFTGAVSGLSFTGSGTGLTSLQASQLVGLVPTSSVSNVSYCIGTTQLTLGRASGSQTLTGVSIDGNAATAGTATNLSGGSVNGTTGTFSGAVSGTTFTSSAVTGIAPFTVSSTTQVANLNVSFLQGYQTATANTANSIVLRDSSGNFSAGSITGTTVIHSSGSAASPSITFSGNTNTGIYSPATNQVAISIAGTQSLTVDASGNVGIGTASNLNSKIVVVGGTTDPNTNPAIAARFVGSGDTSSAVVSIRRANNSGGGLGNPEIGLDVNIPNTYNSSGIAYGIKCFTAQNLGGEHYAGYFEASGNAYSNGVGVYAKTTHTDTNGPGWQPAIRADAFSTIGATNSGYAVGLHARTNNYINNINLVLESQYNGAANQTFAQFIRNNNVIGSIGSNSSSTSYYTSLTSGLVSADSNTITFQTNSTERLRIDSSGIITATGAVISSTTAKAWVNFNGTTSPGTIRASYNVSSVSKNGTGLFTINFINSFPDTNYTSVFGGWNNGNSNGNWNSEYGGSNGAYGTGKNAGNLNIATYNNTGSFQDQSGVYIAFFR